MRNLSSIISNIGLNFLDDVDIPQPKKPIPFGNKPTGALKQRRANRKLKNRKRSG